MLFSNCGRLFYTSVWFCYFCDKMVSTGYIFCWTKRFRIHHRKHNRRTSRRALSRLLSSVLFDIVSWIFYSCIVLQENKYILKLLMSVSYLLRMMSNKFIFITIQSQNLTCRRCSGSCWRCRGCCSLSIYEI